jgi:SAM-dependent methyltransferase
MDLNTAIALIQSPLIRNPGPTRWADLGAGSGLFTKALALLLSPGSEIYAVDKKPAAAFADFPEEIILHKTELDFVMQELPFRNMDGILMANSFHYVKDKDSFIRKLKQTLKKTGILIMVEYDTNIPTGGWVPYPMDFPRLKSFFKEAGFGSVEKLGEYPSIYRKTIYSAIVRY